MNFEMGGRIGKPKFKGNYDVCIWWSWKSASFKSNQVWFCKGHYDF